MASCLIVVALDEGARDSGPGTVVGVVASKGEWDARNKPDPRVRFWAAGRFKPGDRVQLVGAAVRGVEQLADRDQWRAFVRSREREMRAVTPVHGAPIAPLADTDTVLMRRIP